MNKATEQNTLSCLFTICVLISVCTPYQLSAQIVINEIHYDPDESGSPVEFIELFNSGSEDMDVTDWHFDKGIAYTFPEGTRLNAGEYVVVVQDPEALIEKYTASRRSRVRSEAVYGPFVGRLDNDGETVELCRSDGIVEDRVKYGAGFPWPIVGDPVPPNLPGNGPSIQLVNPQYSTENNWHDTAMVDDGTQGDAQIGIPAPFSYYFHFRVIDGEQEAPDPWRGDFWGAIFAQETYDSCFLEAHDLAPGNLYKLINSTNDAKHQQRYQAPKAVTSPINPRSATWARRVIQSMTCISRPPPLTIPRAGVDLPPWSGASEKWSPVSC